MEGVTVLIHDQLDEELGFVLHGCSGGESACPDGDSIAAPLSLSLVKPSFPQFLHAVF